MRRTSILVVVALVLSPLAAAPALAVWGEKARGCPRWESQLAALEQGGGDPGSPRLVRLRGRIGSRCVALNEIQVLGSHNSYHIEPRPALMNLLLIFDPSFSAWQYTHLPLAEQLIQDDRGKRGGSRPWAAAPSAYVVGVSRRLFAHSISSARSLVGVKR